jgi:hypothetical protein
LVNKTPKRTKNITKDILGEIKTAREEFFNTMRERLSEKRPADVPQNNTHRYS